MLDDVTTAALHSALNGLSMRQRVIANNIANIETPGFHAGRVQFENALASAVDSGSGDVSPTIAQSLEPTRLDGNNVNLDHETLSNVGYVEVVFPGVCPVLFVHYARLQVTDKVWS